MSNSDVVQGVLQERERITREREKFFSPELDAKIAEFNKLEADLESVRKEIARLTGGAKESVASPERATAKGRKKGGRKLQNSEVESQVLNYLRNLDQGKGAAGKTIAGKLQKDHWPDVPLNTIYSKVMKFLNEEQGKGTPKVKKEGELINSRWFAVTDGQPSH